MDGLITEIQRFSLNDGPGIRTTVFLKGCNMNCSWCHNPETINGSKDILYYENNCIGCFKCVVICPSKAHKRIGGIHKYYPKLCVKCGKCTNICYAGSMVMSGINMTVNDVMDEIIQDKPYYLDSNGGVTISGGEVLCQQEFTSELIEACQNEGIHVAVETNLSKEFDSIKDLLGKLDLIMCDIKTIETSDHHMYTGIGNDTILRNIKQLHTLGIPFIVRTPLIPGATDSDDNIKGIAEFLSNIKGMEYYELLNFNPLGEYKYKSLSKKNHFIDAKPLQKSRLQELADMVRSYGINVKLG